MNARSHYQRLMQRCSEVSDLGYAMALSSWDQETMMPPEGAAARASQLATLAGLKHELFTAPLVLESLSECEASLAQFDAIETAQVRELRYDYDRAIRVPRALVEELARTQSAALQAWKEAREHDRFAGFVPHLSALVRLTRQKADAIGWKEERYDALIDEYERGATTRSITACFDELKVALVPLVLRVLERGACVEVGCVQGQFDVATQATLGDEIVAAMGFDLKAGRIDPSTHPFCTTVGAADVRLTRRFSAVDLRPALYGIIHEAGHGLYEQGIPPEWRRTPLGDAVSLGVHESQSRLWENVVGRSREFAQFLLPRLTAHFPAAFAQRSAETLYRALNHVQASTIRVEADELTYNLHILLRFELERALFADQITIEEIPERWNGLLQQLLNLRPGNDAEGCLQDIHWAMGAFGYFPTYTLGNVYAAQFFAAARQALDGLRSAIARGEFAPLREWLRHEVHARARLLQPRRLEVATGSPPSCAFFVRHLEEKFGEIYGLA